MKLTPKAILIATLLQVSASCIADNYSKLPQYFPVRDRQEVTSLDGTWQFQLNGEQDWRSIQVPGNWERQGVKTPDYGSDLKKVEGTYKRTFMYDKYWEGRDVILRLDGVQNGFTAYINGHEIGSGHSGHTMHQYNITQYLQQGKNEITIKVSSQSDYWLFDVCDAWSFTGIQHSVELFSVPREANIADVIFTSKVNQDNSADITVKCKVNEGIVKEYKATESKANEYKVTASLLDERYNHVLDLQGSIQNNSVVLQSHLTTPRLWTAETPNLYLLNVTLYNKEGKKLQTVEDRVGIREIRIGRATPDADSCSVLLNNHPIFLRGACLSENDAIEGSAMTPETFRKILLQMKAANINFIRTAHYPLNPAFNRLCDELGFYVCEEIPFASRGGDSLKANTPQVIQELKDRAKATIDRDRNRPSIILWTHGNENNIYAPQDSCLKFTMEYDPTRLRGVPQAKGPFQSFIKRPSKFVDVICGHYANDGVLANACEVSTKPLINTEYAHSLGSATGELENKYSIFRREPKIAGGSIWSYEDQSVLTYNYNQQNQVEKGVRIDSLRYIDSYGLNPAPEGAREVGKEGSDGIVYGNLYPSDDYFHVAQVYSPVKVSPSFSNGKVTATVSNEHDFISLRGFQLQWKLKHYKETTDQGTIYLTSEAGKTEDITIPVSLPTAEGMYWEASILRPDGSLCYQKSVMLDTLTDYAKALMDEPVVKSKGKGYDVLQDILKNAFSLRVGRPITIGLDYHRKGLWPEYMIAPSDIAVKKQKGGYALSCRWVNPDKKDSFFSGTFNIKPSAKGGAGALDITYAITPSDSVGGKVFDFGVTMVMPKYFTDVAWFGQGPFSHPADKHAYNNPGVWQLNKADMRFWGNRGEVQLLTTYAPSVNSEACKSVSIVSDRHNLFLEKIGERIYITDVTNVSEYGTKFKSPKPASAKPSGKVNGHFVLRQNATNLNAKVFGTFSPAIPENPFLDCYGK